MPSNPKLYLPNGVHFVTFRTETGLPFVAADHVKLILEGILARATDRFDLRICHYLWMANHVHLIVVVRDPEALADFLCFVKTESAHAVNRMLGIRRRTVWCAGSDSPILLSPESVLDKIAYLYANPASASLVDSIDDYPMLSSWEMYASGRHTKDCPVIGRDQIPVLGQRHLSLRHQQAFCRSLIAASNSSARLRIFPFAWMNSFPQLKGVTRREIHEDTVVRLRRKESDARTSRAGLLKGALALRTEDVNLSPAPEKYQPKMICICVDDKELRVRFLTWAKEQFHLAREVYKDWKRGIRTRMFPPGLFAPRPRRIANLLNPL